MLFGLVLLIAPGALAVVFVIGACAIVFGITVLGLAWRLREHHQTAMGRAPLGGPASAA